MGQAVLENFDTYEGISGFEKIKETREGVQWICDKLKQNAKDREILLSLKKENIDRLNQLEDDAGISTYDLEREDTDEKGARAMSYIRGLLQLEADLTEFQIYRRLRVNEEFSDAAISDVRNLLKQMEFTNEIDSCSGKYFNRNV